jgi:hypothetical protein
MRPTLLLIVLVAACGGQGSGESTTTTSTTSTTIPTTTTTQRTTTSGADACAAGIEEINQTVGIVLDRIDADPQIFLSKESSDALDEVFTEIGGTLATACTTNDLVGEAISGLITYLAHETTTRPALTTTFIEGMLEGLCNDFTEYPFTLQATAACATVS